MPLLPLPPPYTATLPRLHLRLLLPLPHSLLLLRRAASRHTRLLLPAAAAGSLPPPAPDALLPNQATGLVAASQANFMRVIVASTAPGLEQHQGADLLCVVRALLKKIRRRVLVGDRVLVGAVDWTDRRGMIEDVFERRTEVADPPVANVDRIVLLFSLDQPQPEPATLTRFLVDAESAGIPFVLVFNKVELVDQQNSKWFGEQRVGTVSKKSGKGKHTTRHVSLLPIVDGGFLADTPGFNQPSLMKLTKQGLAETFPEIRRMLEENEPSQCLFNDCAHIGERGCVVKGDWERYPYYLQLLDEIKIRESFQLRTFGTKREGDVRYKTGTMGVKQAEPRLQLKKHRRVSRKKMNQSILDDIDAEMDDPDDDYQFGVSRRSGKR